MKIKIFVDWRNETIHTEKTIEKEKKDILDDVISDEYINILEEYLDKHYSLVEIYNLKEDEKIKIKERVNQECKSRMEYIVADDYEEITLEI